MACWIQFLGRLRWLLLTLGGKVRKGAPLLRKNCLENENFASPFSYTGREVDRAVISSFSFQFKIWADFLPLSLLRKTRFNLNLKLVPVGHVPQVDFRCLVVRFGRFRLRMGERR